MNSYELISLLLRYPDAQSLANTDALAQSCCDLTNPTQRKLIEQFLADRRLKSLIQLQREHVATFDFSKRATPYLSFHAYGDRRERGVAMLALKRRYAAAGFTLIEGELPDYLPILLEFCAYAPPKFGKVLLDEFRVAVELVRAALHQERSPYSLLLDALCVGLPDATATQRQQVKDRAATGPPTELVGLEPFTTKVGPASENSPIGAGSEL